MGLLFAANLVLLDRFVGLSMQSQRHVATAIFLRERRYNWDVPVGMMSDQWSIAVAYSKGEAG